MSERRREFLKPRDGLLIRRPDNGQRLKAEGESVQMSTYWRKRLACGDVVKATPKPAKKGSK